MERLDISFQRTRRKSPPHSSPPTRSGSRGSWDEVAQGVYVNVEQWMWIPGARGLSLPGGGLPVPSHKTLLQR